MYEIIRQTHPPSIKTESCGGCVQSTKETLTDSHQKSNAFNDYFTSIFTQGDLSSFPKLNDSSFPEIPNIPVSVKGVANLLHNLNPHKATGPDGIPAYFLKELSYEIAPILTKNFQSS